MTEQNRLRITVSGIRGPVPDALNVDVASKFASAFSAYLEQGEIAVCRDYRFSSHMLQMAVVSAITASGLNCIDFGRLPVSFLQFLMQRGRFTGGLAVSAGHNPLPWNAVILLNEAGFYLEALEGAEVFNIYEAESFQKAAWDQLGEFREEAFPIHDYLTGLSNIVNTEAIRKSAFKLVADPCHSVVTPYLRDFAEFFRLDMITINDVPERPFPHPPEPNPENASQAEAVVKAVDADLGFLLNSDGSRLSLVNEKGTALSEEYTVPFCLLALKNKIRKAVTTAATSALLDWAAKSAGIELLRTKVGQSAVLHLMEAEGAKAGGEGSGSFAYLPFSPSYDALLALSLTLELLTQEEKPVSELVSKFPQLHRKKIKIKVPPVKTYQIMDRLECEFQREEMDITDGIRIKRPGVWFIIRPSTTEFILRIMIEGESQNLVEKVEEEIRERIEP